MPPIPLELGAAVGGVVPIEQLDEKTYRVRHLCCGAVGLMSLQAIRNRRWSEARGQSCICRICGHTRKEADERIRAEKAKRMREKQALKEKLEARLIDKDDAMDLLHSTAPPQVRYTLGWPSCYFSPQEVARKREPKGGY